MFLRSPLSSVLSGVLLGSFLAGIVAAFLRDAGVIPDLLGAYTLYGYLGLTALAGAALVVVLDRDDDALVRRNEYAELRDAFRRVEDALAKAGASGAFAPPPSPPRNAAISLADAIPGLR